MKCSLLVLTAAILGSACGQLPSSSSPGLLPAPSSSPPPGAVIEATVVPDHILVERVRGAQRISCDFRLRNTSAATQTLRTISVTALDASGVLLQQRSVDFRGISPAIETIPGRVIEPGKAAFLFNPLDLFADDLALASLRFQLDFIDAERKTSAAVVTVPVHAFRPASRLEVPLDGNVLVAHGHGFTDPHRRIDLDHPALRAFGLGVNSARYAVDLAVVDDRGRMFEGDGDRLEQWKGYGAIVRSPAAGTVLHVIDGQPENRMTPSGVEFTVDPGQPTTFLGNVVVVEHAGGEVSLFAHLRAGSLRVKPGDRVTAGAPLGAIGFSGNLDFVHTHYQVMRRSKPAAPGETALVAALGFEAIPIYFHDFERIAGARATPVSMAAVDTGDIIRRRHAR